MSSDRSISSLVIAVIMIIFIAYTMNALFRPAPPTLEVEDFSLNPDSIKAGETATLEFDIKSNDEDKSHFLRVEFESHTLVVFRLGNENLPVENGKWYYTTTVNPSATIVQPIYVTAALSSGVAEIKYGITVNFFVDGNQFNSRRTELTVRW